MPSSWTAYSKRKSHCQADILEGWICQMDDPEIIEGQPIGRVRMGTITVDYHPACWLETSIGILLQTPYAPKGKGRRKLDISDEQRKERRKVQSRYSAFQSRIYNYSVRIMNEDLNSADLSLAILMLEIKQDKLWYEMKGLGGPPTRWRIPNGNKDTQVSEESDKGSSLSAGTT